MADAVQDPAAAGADNPAPAAAEPAAADAGNTPAPAAAPQPVTVDPEAQKAALKAALVLPKDSPLDPAKSVDRAFAWAEQHKVAPEVAKTVLELAHTEAADVLVQYEAARAPGGVIHAATVERYAADALAHPQLGNGDPVRFQQVQQQVGLVLGKYGTEGLAEDIKARGYMTPNEMLFLAKIYKAQGESHWVAGSGQPTEDLPWERKMYTKGMLDDTGAKATL